ncbi:unnamed protein product [Adineta ricciae]|uniref:Uncharacterized protein n=1 Tax=Adineta ricciae TaxID=249248 RepID=A0A815D9Y8_ADIRI|nr:unnamed protein product [Adineta ricciae]
MESTVADISHELTDGINYYNKIRSVYSLISYSDDLNQVALSPEARKFIDDILNQPDSNEDMVNSVASSSNANAESPEDLLTESSSISPSLHTSTPLYNENLLSIVAQPHYTFRLRTIDQYKKDRRRCTLTAKESNSNFSGPTIRISPAYINTTEPYYIGIFLVTVLHETTSCRYFHPYGLQDVEEKAIRNEKDNSLWYPIQPPSSTGFQSFPNIRINKPNEKDMKTDGLLNIFYGYVSGANLLNTTVPGSSTARKLVSEYNLKRAQLAFVIGKKQRPDDEYPSVFDPSMIIYSEEMAEKNEKESNKSKKPTTASNVPSNDLQIVKYAPHYGDSEGNEDMIIMLSKTLSSKEAKDLRITFKFGPDDILSHTIDHKNIEVRPYTLSFKTPRFPRMIHKKTIATIIVESREMAHAPLVYEYRPKYPYVLKVYDGVVAHSMDSYQNAEHFVEQGFTDDAEVPNATIQLKSLPQRTTSQPSRIVCTPAVDEGLQAKVYESVTALFSENDLKPFLRISRAFIRKQPQLLHIAIARNYSDLLVKFIPGTNIDLFQSTNPHGESLLLHAVRLNRLSVVRALLELKKSTELLDAVNNEGENIVHLMAKDKELKEMFDVFAEYCERKSINMHEKFDKVEKTNRRLLKLAIMHNNLWAVRALLPGFDKDVCKSNDDNLIHLAVRYGDLELLKCLLDNEELKKQGNERSGSVTATELAESLKHDETVKYLKKVYSSCKTDTDK